MLLCFMFVFWLIIFSRGSRKPGQYVAQHHPGVLSVVGNKMLANIYYEIHWTFGNIGVQLDSQCWRYFEKNLELDA